MKVKDAAKNIIEAKEQGEKAVDAQVRLFVDDLMDQAKAKMKPNSSLETYKAAVREADTRWRSLTLRVKEAGINLDENGFRKMTVDTAPSIAGMLGWT